VVAVVPVAAEVAVVVVVDVGDNRRAT